ncbi:PP2C family protein-serine/threonine phosphatase [Streptomyces sp. NPDC001165]|uniref:PP2C family protein-serine/threonine phosphatase n=1 Tax=Streptomyces sp. NPDC001165 TaxID=3364546 RepID=UPI0036C06C73
MGVTAGTGQPTVDQVDYAALFAAAPSPYLVLSPALVIVGVNEAYCRATGRTSQELVGERFFDAFPDNPADPKANGVLNLSTSLERVLATRKPDTMAVQRYDIPVAGQPDAFEERWWSTVNTPVGGPDGRVAWIIHRVEDVSSFVRERRQRQRDSTAPQGRPAEGMEAELYARAKELERLNDELRRAHARERQVAITLQEAMLHSPDLARHSNVAVRYLPAIGSLNVCGDWYDTADLTDGRFTVAVGDVVGHGLEAATVMGMLRSALSAASRAVAGPAQALEILGLYARSVDGALAATAVTALVDTRSQLIVYSSAGHPPPVLMHRRGACELLDRATDPPLGARPAHVPRPQAGTAYHRGDVLVLYTDGLIERRDEDIDTGLQRLADALAQCLGLGPERLADTLLARLGVSHGARDDIALVVVAL